MNRKLIILRAARRISAAEIGRRAGVVTSTITRVELGQVTPKPATRRAIASALGADPDWLFTAGDEEDGNPS